MTEWRPVVAAVAGTLLLAGCTSGADGTDGDKKPTAPARDAKPSGSAAPSAPESAEEVNEPYTMAEERAPRTRAEAVEFVRGLDTRPDHFGTGFRKASPYESDPGEWAVLDEECVWQRETLPKTVLASLTRRFVLPAKDGKGAVQVSLTVTVHRDTKAARRDMAASLQEALRCPDQRLNATERVRGLFSRADPFAEGRNGVTDDDLVETGTYLVDGVKGEFVFDWFKYRLGPVTVAATDRIGAGHSKEEARQLASDVAQGVTHTAAEIDSIGGSEGKDSTGDSDGKGAGDE
ncbi:hypothetical protein Stsp02_28350 [Streptomyces sp. NBRC 14336]|uniref:hypothetical protein n=1 Tax=Streptomyces sp. NBRC 14336 TaxID=3030992 RepID=UPI00249FDFE3|nr:hypothetical protein [Streptomyces sp. NBRC 14336]WBO82256.1 hypothetical protein SBE_006175 [Streptomyces sp. SBE_14.2]GLW47173.1 hypothetical protein Stsp02_28350 [Streptomyces sp. NBRC 14336]